MGVFIFFPMAWSGGLGAQKSTYNKMFLLTWSLHHSHPRLGLHPLRLLYTHTHTHIHTHTPDRSFKHLSQVTSPCCSNTPVLPSIPPIACGALQALSRPPSHPSGFTASALCPNHPGLLTALQTHQDHAGLRAFVPAVPCAALTSFRSQLLETTPGHPI